MDFDSLSEKELLIECIQGRKQAWDAFVEKYKNLIYHTIYKTLKGFHTDTDDICNSVFLSLMENDYKKLKQYKGKNGCKVPSWLSKVTTNFTLNYIKKQKKYKPIEDDTTDNVDVIGKVSDPQQQPDEELLKKESEEMRKKLVKVLVKDLNAKDKLFLELSYGKKLPPGKIAEILSITVDNVYSKKNRIIEKLRKTAKNENLLQDLLYLLRDN